MSADVTVVVTWYQKEKWWPMVLHGLAINKDDIAHVIIANDDHWGEWTPSAPASGLTIQLTEQEHRGWGAGTALNGAMKLVTTPYVLHIDGDMMLTKGSVALSRLYMEDVSLLAGRVYNTSDDAHLVSFDPRGKLLKSPLLEASIITPDSRNTSFRHPLPLNLRHGHFMCHTDKWLPHPTQEFQIEGEDAYFSMDYVLAARWMMTYGKESFAYGGGEALHLGGHYTTPQPEAESTDNKRKVRAYLDKYVAYFDEPPCTWNQEELSR